MQYTHDANGYPGKDKDVETGQTGKCNIPICDIGKDKDLRNVNGYPGKDKYGCWDWTDWEVQHTHVCEWVSRKRPGC